MKRLYIRIINTLLFPIRDSVLDTQWEVLGHGYYLEKALSDIQALKAENARLEDKLTAVLEGASKIAAIHCNAVEAKLKTYISTKLISADV